MPKMAVKIDKAKNGVTVAMILADSCQSYATGFVFSSVRWQLVFFYPYFLSYLVVYRLFFYSNFLCYLVVFGLYFSK